MTAIFKNRQDAGKQLAKLLSDYADDSNSIVLGMPRGGVVVAAEIAKAFHLPLDVMIARKIGAPGQSEFAIGAIAPGGIVMLDETYIQMYGLSESAIQNMIADEKEELERRIHVYCGDKGLPNLNGKTVILVDDGIATGRTALAAVRAVRAMKPSQIILAAGVCAADSAEKLKPEVDKLICIACPHDFYAVGAWYENFDQTTDDEVIQLLQKNR